MGMRVFEGLMQLADAFGESAAIHEEAMVAATGMSSVVLERNIHDVFGDSNKLATLAQSTQDERTDLGYSPNDPLVRDGRFLRASIERGHQGLVAGVGSSEPAMEAHEFGYLTRPFGNPNAALVSVPPRPVFRIGMQESEPEIGAIVDEALAITFNGGRPSITSTP
jgi:phage gpG-like protein